MGEKVRDNDALAKPADAGLSAHFRTRIDPFSSLVLTAPVFVFYHIGILFSDTRNGVDLFTSWMVRLVEQDMRLYVLVTLGLALAIVGAGFILRRRGVLRPVAIGPVLVESFGWALVLWLSVGWATQRILDLQTGAEGVGFFGAFVVSAGAGFHEELVFRAGLFSGFRKLLKHVTELPAAVPWIVAGLVSAVLFSLAHYVGALGDDFTWASFIFRALMGLMLAAIYQLRGFAVAVYAHAFYDVIYFLVLR